MKDADNENRPEVRLGISSCLLGIECRWNGVHKRDGFLVNTVSEFAEFVHCCPEYEIGLGIPREPLRLVRYDDGIRLMTSKTGKDHTEAMKDYSRKRIEELKSESLDGYVLKKASPSCGMERVKVYKPDGHPLPPDAGIFGGMLVKAMPDLPVEEEGRLNDPRLRENFFERLFAHARLRKLFDSEWSTGDLVRFHTSEKLLLLAHDPENYRKLGRLVASAKDSDKAELEKTYRGLYMRALSNLSTIGSNFNVLQHMSGYLRNIASIRARQDLHNTLEDYRRGFVPLVVPLTVIRHYARAYEVDYLLAQYYINPHPRELKLRNYS
ncbi:MAG: DUF523 and DUF1722 domain-containing protein [Planctomycetota bacterium]|nr:DUF523 and DUF1722 domain-containing protein [Planctomycetota bacterium]